MRIVIAQVLLSKLSMTKGVHKEVKKLVNSFHGSTTTSPRILYIKANMVSVCLCGQKLGSAWKILPVTARSLWSW
jgi:hypothetical protein